LRWEGKIVLERGERRGARRGGEEEGKEGGREGGQGKRSGQRVDGMRVAVAPSWWWPLFKGGRTWRKINNQTHTHTHTQQHHKKDKTRGGEKVKGRKKIRRTKSVYPQMLLF
jgi:hypothetical protein